jgi:uncharacterized protein YgiM (DUF1202 family)
MKNNTALIVVGVIVLLAVPVVVMAARRRKKSSVSAGSPEKQTQAEFEADRAKATPLPGPLGGIGAAVTAFLATLPTYQVVTQGSELNIRKEPNTTSEIIGKLKNGEKVKGSVPKNGWIQVAKGKQGFVSARFMKKVADGVAAVK